MKQDYNRSSGSSDSSWGDPLLWFVVIAGGYAACKAAWYFGHTQISTAYVYLRYVELWVLGFIGSAVEIPVISSVSAWLHEACQPESMFGRCTRDFYTFSWEELSRSSVIVNSIFIAIITVWCGRMFVYANKHHPKLKFTKTHNIKSYVAECEQLYPHLRLFSKLDLLAKPLDHPVFGMSLTSRQFAYKHHLIVGWQEDAGGDKDGRWAPIVDRVRAAAVFKAQLGKHWTKSTELSPGETILIAIALPLVAATDHSLNTSEFDAAKADSQKMIDWCWDQFIPPSKKELETLSNDDVYNWLKPEIDLEFPRGLIRKYISRGSVRAVLEQHAFVRTVIYGMFFNARRLGVLPPCDIRWMRFFDRELWYVLQTLGRGSGFAEGDAALCHYLYEKRSKEAIVEPQVDKVIDGLERVITTFKYSDEDKANYERLVAMAKSTNK